MKDFSETGGRASGIPVLAVLGFVALAGCQTTSEQLASTGIPEKLAINPPTTILASIPQDKIDTEARRVAAEGIAELDQHAYGRSTESFNKALKLDISNSYLHYLNGLSYHLRAKRDEAQYYPLAVKGYEMALKFDSSNWLAQYYLGLIYMDQRKFNIAQRHLSQAVLHNSTDPEVLYQLASASYYARDLRTASATLGKMRKLDLRDDWRRKVSRVSAITSAASNNLQEANLHFATYEALEAKPVTAERVRRRMDSWKRTHDVVNLKQFAQNQSTEEEEEEEEEETEVEEDSDEYEEDFVDSQMAVVEVTIIRTEEDINTSKGVNLLSGLQIQFGDVLNGTPGLGIARNSINDLTTDLDDQVNTRTITHMISLPAISYSLNIANAQNGRNEVLARPTLVARTGQTSEFFSGVEVAAAATSGGSGDSISIEKEIGVKLSVTPEFLPGDSILLNVTAERTFLTQPSRSVEFQFRLDTSKTTVNANVAMKFGQTLILSGLTERETEKNRDGVPGLQDVPLVQYLFSRATTRDFRKSVMILMTPRKAQYLHESGKDRKKRLARMTAQERARALLEQKYSDWFDPLPATGAVFQHLRSNELYNQEFRTGDFPVEKWNSKQTHIDRLRDLADFLYY